MRDSSDSYIVLVEPETDLANTIQRSLEEEGYRVKWMKDGQQSLRQVSRSQPTLMIVDSELPDMSGHEVCRTTQSMNYHIPIVLLSTMDSSGATRSKSGEPDEILKKPIEIDQLIRVANSLIQSANPHLDINSGSVLSLGSVQVDLANYSVYTASGTEELTEREAELLRYLYNNPGKPIKRKDLLENVWQYQNTTNTRTVDVHIAKLRSKIERDPSDPEIIITIHGIGYMMETED